MRQKERHGAKILVYNLLHRKGTLPTRSVKQTERHWAKILVDFLLHRKGTIDLLEV